MTTFLDGLDPSLYGMAPPIGAIPGDQPPGVPSGAPMAPPMAPPPPQLNAGDYMQAEGPQGGASAPPAGFLDRLKQGAGGLLHGLTATSPDGITFANKLMAAGAMLHGQGGQAMDYLQQQRDTAMKQKLMAQSMASKQAQAAAFQEAAAGNPRMALLAKLAAAQGPNFDLDEVAKAGKLLTPERKFMNSGPNIIEADETPDSGKVLYTGHDKPGQFMKWDPAQGKDVPDEDAIGAFVKAWGGRYKEQGLYKKFAPQRPMPSLLPQGATPLN